MRRDDLEYATESVDGRTWVYRLSGCLYGTAAGYAFQHEVREKIAHGAKGIVIDLATVDRIDSCGIGILVATMWSASNSGAGLVLAALSSRVEKVLSIAMLLDRVGHAPTVEAALARLRAMGSAT
jgi:anti-anti-sigma factor